MIVLNVVPGEPAAGATRASKGGGQSRARNVRKWLRRGAIVALVIVAASVGAKLWIDRQWYVGESAGRVAVFQGIPAHVAGFHLSRVVEIERDLPATKAQALPLFSDLPDGITTSSRTAAEQIVTSIRVEVRGSTVPGGSGGSSGSGGGSGTSGGGASPGLVKTRRCLRSTTTVFERPWLKLCLTLPVSTVRLRPSGGRVPSFGFSVWSAILFLRQISSAEPVPKAGSPPSK